VSNGLFTAIASGPDQRKNATGESYLYCAGADSGGKQLLEDDEA